MHRQVVLDTETTGIRVEDGHRIIEIGCVEMIDRKLTGKHFHHYINPRREVEAGAFAIHGISNEFLTDKPIFDNIADELMAFISGAELIIHNAPFDLGFINREFFLIKPNWTGILDFCRVIDTLKIARETHIGQRNSLDALCKRYGVDNSKREYHGALLDAHLLAQVYLAMTGGQGSFFDVLSTQQHETTKNMNEISETIFSQFTIVVLKADTDELLEHKNYLLNMKTRGKCLWLDENEAASACA